ncbi:hypothetical protein SMC26_27065 [Actinomadura fulvescens]|uniref:Methylamine utilisation protein MauE domain-containing protein n=1 Tax=Actinomadura fulvescens TaxID=46160 RepID=A0ABN3PKS3_9ACTN
MSAILVIVPAIVFGWAAIRKIMDPGETEQWLADLGFIWATRRFVRLIIGADLLVAGALIAAPRLGAALALAYLLASIPFIARGRAVGTGCSCFGKRTDSYLTSSWRNAALAGVILAWATGAVVAPGPWREQAWPVSLSIAVAATYIALAGVRKVFVRD